MNSRSSIGFEYIDTASALKNLGKLIKSAALVAIDTEADSLYHYYEKVCLIQLTAGDKNFIIDPLIGLDLTTFLDILSNRELVLHGSEYDLRMLYRSYKFKPQKNVFDTAIAAQLLGFEKIGLIDLAESILAKKMSKHGQRSDWSRRPLTDNQLIYACDDTRYLDSLADNLRNKLVKLGRLTWQNECCERVVEVTSVDKTPADPEREWQIKGVRKLTLKQQAVVRGLWYWREAEAQAVDLPPFKILLNRTIFDLAVWATAGKNLKEDSRPQLPRNCVNMRLDKLYKALKKARELPESEYPKHKRNTYLPPLNQDLTDSLRPEINRIAAGLNLKPSVIAPRAALEAIAARLPKDIEGIMQAGQLMRWQAGLISTTVLDLIHNYIGK